MAKGFFVGVDGVAKKVKEGFIGITHILPSGYTQLEYIETTGNQYVDTELSTSADMGLDVDFSPNYIGGSSRAIFGAITASSSGYHGFVYAATGIFYSYWGTGIQSLSSAGTATVGTKYNVKFNYLNSGSVLIDGTSYTTLSSAIITSNNMWIGKLNPGSTTVNEAFNGRIYSAKVTVGSAVKRNYIPAKNSDGEVGLFDLVDMRFYTDKSGTGFVAGDEVNQNYSISIARRIKQAFIGIGGIARPCWYEGKLGYYGAITNLSTNKYDHAATTVGNYALFGGGHTTTSASTGNVDAYDGSLTHMNPDGMTFSRYDLAATTVGNYAIFAGGYTTNENFKVDVYNESLTHTNLSDGTSYRYDLAATTVGDYAVFAGGQNVGYGSTTVDAYDKSLTRTTPTVLESGRYALAATTIGDYAIFMGGRNRTYSDGSELGDADVYDKSLTRMDLAENLYLRRKDLAAATVGDYAVFAGGYGNSSYRNYVDAYNRSLTQTCPEVLSQYRYSLTATTVGDYALFAGGVYIDASDVVDVYDKSLIHTVQTSLSVPRYQFAATSVGDYALFGGGYESASKHYYYSTVDAYAVM